MTKVNFKATDSSQGQMYILVGIKQVLQSAQTFHATV